MAIHDSTQFGAYSIEDIRFLENMGVRRVVLARELTLQKIQALRMQTSMELEVLYMAHSASVFQDNAYGAA